MVLGTGLATSPGALPLPLESVRSALLWLLAALAIEARKLILPCWGILKPVVNLILLVKLVRPVEADGPAWGRSGVQRLDGGGEASRCRFLLGVLGVPVVVAGGLEGVVGPTRCAGAAATAGGKVGEAEAGPTWDLKMAKSWANGMKRER